MAATHKDAHTVDNDSFPYTFEKNVTIPLKSTSGIVRANVYRPKSSDNSPVPVLVTYGPYGKDIYYENFHKQSFDELPEHQRSAHSAWEVPDPGYWTSVGYAVVRVDERGTGQSPGLLDTMSKSTCECFFDAIEWAAEQSWSSGKVGLLGISYYSGTQWRVAALQPKGLSAIIPWEGMSDYYRDRCRHGGILSNEFISFWWNRQVVSNQYGLGDRSSRKWGDDPIDGVLPDDVLKANRNDQQVDNANNYFRDDEYYASKEYTMEDIKVPLLSAANLGGIMLHLRGNIQGYLNAGSEKKFLRLICGRHDLPFYYDEEVSVQKSFLDAFLKGQDNDGWSTGKVPPVSVVLRKGNVGFNNPAAEKTFARRPEQEWPIARTVYTPFNLTSEKQLLVNDFQQPTSFKKLSYHALGSLERPELIQFSTPPFEAETEITGHPVARLNVSATAYIGKSVPKDIDLFLTLRHFDPSGQEVFYTGTAGDPVPLCKGWLRVSLRKVNKGHHRHREYLPHRDYFSTDVQPVIPGEVYPVDVELWPTSVVVEKGGRIVLEVASGDTQGCGIFKHAGPEDRTEAKLAGYNHVHFGPHYQNYVTLPIIPEVSKTP